MFACKHLSAIHLHFLPEIQEAVLQKEILPEDAKKLCELMPAQNFGTLVAHAPYTMNVCSAKEDMLKEALNEELKPEMNTIVLLETMAGKGSEVGATFEELRGMID